MTERSHYPPLGSQHSATLATSGNGCHAGCLCGPGCISCWDDRPCDCFCDGDPDGKHHYDHRAVPDRDNPRDNYECGRCSEPWPCSTYREEALRGR